MKQSETVLQRNSFIFVAVFNGYSFSSLLLLTATGKFSDYKDFVETVLFVKTKEMIVKTFAFLLFPIFLIFCRKNIAAFWNRSRRALVE